MRTTPKNRNALTRVSESKSVPAAKESSRSSFLCNEGMCQANDKGSLFKHGKVPILVNKGKARREESQSQSPPRKIDMKDYSKPLEISYAKDYDIKKVDNYIKEYFMVQNTKLPGLRTRVDQIEAELDEEIPISKEKRLQREVDELRAIIKRIESGDSYQHYYLNTNQLIIDYNNISKEDDMFSERKCEKIVDTFLKIASKYIPMQIKKELPSKTECFCTNCGESLNGVKQSITGHKICAVCEYDNFVLKHVNIVKEYDTWGNFLKAFNRHTGIAYLNANSVKFNIEELMKSLDQYSIKKGKPPGEYYRKQPLNSRGKKDNTSHEFICEALCALNYKDFYKDYMYICHHYYGWKYPDIKHLLGEIEINFKIKQEVWKKMTDLEKGGQSSLPTQYRLYREFQHVGIKCQASDFRLAEKKETLDRHDRVYITMCKRANIPFPHKRKRNNSDAEDSSSGTNETQSSSVSEESYSESNSSNSSESSYNKSCED